MDLSSKRNKLILLVLLFLFVAILVVGGVWFFFIKDEASENDNSEEEQQQEQIEVTMPEYDERDSAEAIANTSEVALEWAADAKLYDCSGLPYTSVIVEDTTFPYLGEDIGKYASWLCTYYSKAKGETVIVEYDEGETELGEPIGTGEYGYLMYDGVDYPTNLSAIANSTDVYRTALNNGLNIEENYYNMYLMETQDYGFAWVVNERSKTDLDEYGIGKLINSYVVDMYSGNLIEVVPEEVY